MKRLLPRPSGRSQTLSRRTRRLLKKGEPRGRTGNQRVRVLVVEKFEWQSSEGRIGTVLVRRGVARRRVGNQQQVPSQKEAEPSEETPDDGGRWREGELGAQVSRVIVKKCAMGFDCGPQARKALHGDRRPGFYECSFLTEWVETGILGFRIRTVARVVRRVTRQLIGRHGADSAVSGDDNRDVRGRSVVCGQGSNSRQKSATGVSIREGVPVARKRHAGLFAGTGEQPK